MRGAQMHLGGVTEDVYAVEGDQLEEEGGALSCLRAKAHTLDHGECSPGPGVWPALHSPGQLPGAAGGRACLPLPTTLSAPVMRQISDVNSAT